MVLDRHLELRHPYVVLPLDEGLLPDVGHLGRLGVVRHRVHRGVGLPDVGLLGEDRRGVDRHRVRRVRHLRACPVGMQTGCYLGVGRRDVVRRGAEHPDVEHLGEVRRRAVRLIACPAGMQTDCCRDAVHPGVGPVSVRSPVLVRLDGTLV